MSENQNETVQTEESAPATIEPGRELRAAREAKGLSLDAVAAELRLTVTLLRALEEGDKEQLPPQTFVNGYIRSYCRLVGLDADKLLGVSVAQPEEVALVSSGSTTRQVSSNSMPVRLVTWGVALGLVALLVVWWLARTPDEVAPEEDEAAAEQLESVAPGDAVTLSLPPTTADDGATAQGEAGNSDAVEGSEGDVMTEGGAAVNESADEPSAATIPLPEFTLVPEGAAAGQALNPPLTNDMAYAGLVIRLKTDSWLEVTDADGRRLAHGLFKGERQVSVTGVAPFSVLLGYAHGAELYLNGEPFDITAHISSGRDVARFAAGAAGDNRQPGS